MNDAIRGDAASGGFCRRVALGGHSADRCGARASARCSTRSAARSAAPATRRWSWRSARWRPTFGPAQASVIGRSERPDVLNAAFLNAVSANVLEYDDTHLPTVMHPAAPVAPALFALAERRPVSGRRAAARVYPRRRGRVPGRQRADAEPLPARLAHHRDLRHLRRRRGGGEAARARRASGRLGARPCGDAIGRARRKPRQHVEEHRGRQRGAKRARRRAVRRGRASPPPSSAIEGRYGFAAVDQRHGRSRRDHRRARRELGNPRTTPTSPTRAASCCSRSSTPASSCASARAVRAEQHRAGRRARPSAAARTHRPPGHPQRPRRQGQPAAQRRRRLPVRRGRARAIRGCLRRRPRGTRAARQGRAEDDDSVPVEARIVTVRLADGATLERARPPRPRHAGPADERRASSTPRSRELVAIRRSVCRRRRR